MKQVVPKTQRRQAISKGSEQATREIILDDIKGTQLEAMALSISREEQARADQLAATMRPTRRNACATPDSRA